jgi:hypothetical protein
MTAQMQLLRQLKLTGTLLVSTLGAVGHHRRRGFEILLSLDNRQRMAETLVEVPPISVCSGQKAPGREADKMNYMQGIGGRNRRRESEMQAELERLRAENAQLKSKDKGGLTLKVSEKGGVSLYGMGRFPVTLYKEQWLRILASAPEIEAFIRENDSRLKTKE